MLIVQLTALKRSNLNKQRGYPIFDFKKKIRVAKKHVKIVTLAMMSMRLPWEGDVKQ